MKLYLSLLAATTALVISSACTQADQAEAQRKAEQAKAQTEQAAKKTEQAVKELGDKASDKAKELGDKTSDATQNGVDRMKGAGESAEEKLSKAARSTGDKADQTGNGISETALTTKVKSRLAADVGLATVNAINVDSNGHTVTLSGNVKAAADKKRAEAAALRVKGVSKVINNLEVAP